MTLRIKRVTVTPGTLRTGLDEFERRYQVKSERLAEAFRDERGALVETEDFHRWCSTYAAWELATRK
jgi:DNA topoisomerase IB